MVNLYFTCGEKACYRENKCVCTVKSKGDLEDNLIMWKENGSFLIVIGIKLKKLNDHCLYLATTSLIALRLGTDTFLYYFTYKSASSGSMS